MKTASTSRHIRRPIGPYGAWFHADGAVTLFDRQYCPLFTWRRGEGVVRVCPTVRIEYVGGVWFYGDATCRHIETVDSVEGCFLDWALAARETELVAAGKAYSYNVDRVRKMRCPKLANVRNGRICDGAPPAVVKLLSKYPPQ